MTTAIHDEDDDVAPIPCPCEVCSAGGDCTADPVASTIGELLREAYGSYNISPRNRDVILRAAQQVIEKIELQDLLLEIQAVIDRQSDKED
jgi:hypothetical protein